MFELLYNNLLFSVPLIFVISLLFFIIISSFVGIDMLSIDLSENVFLGWNKGGTPVIFSFLSFLLLFGFIGLLFIKLKIISALEINVLISLMLAFVGTRLLHLSVFQYLPKEESYVISNKSLIGKIAVVINDSESKDLFTEAKFIDCVGTSHYVLVKSNNNILFNKGDRVLLVDKLDSEKFTGIKSIDN